MKCPVCGAPLNVGKCDYCGYVETQKNKSETQDFKQVKMEQEQQMINHNAILNHTWS